MKYRPLDGRVMIKNIPPKEVSRGGIYVLDRLREPTYFGKVIAVGNNLEYGIKVGDVVCFGKIAYNDVELEGERYILIREKLIQAVLNDV